MNMRERAALALGAVITGGEVQPKGKWLEAVDAVLAVMREPSEEVKDAGRLRFTGDFSEWTIDITPGFQAMIRAIKSGK